MLETPEPGLIVKVIPWRSTTPVLVPVRDAIVSSVSNSIVPWISKLTLSPKPPCAFVKSAFVYWSTSSVPVPVTKSKNSYSRRAAAFELPFPRSVNVLLPRLIAVVCVPSVSSPNWIFPPLISVKFPL